MSLFELVRSIGQKPAIPPNRVAAAVESVVTHVAHFAATIRKDYPMMIRAIDAKIEAARRELEAAEAQRATLAYEAHATDGEAKGGAASKLKAANSECERLQRTIADLQAARVEAVKRQGDAEAEAERAAEAERRKVAAVAHKKMMAAVVAAEKAVDDAATALAAARDAKNDFCKAWPPRSAHDVVFAAWDAVNPCVRFKLRDIGMKPPLFMTADQAKWAAYFPGLDRLGLAQD